MHNVQADILKNRLYLTLGNIASKEEMQAIEVQVLQQVKCLKQGFTCVSDLRNFCMEKSLSDNFMQEIQEILWDSGVRAVARISPIRECKGHFRFEKGSALWPGYTIIPVISLAEAEEKLNNLDTHSA
ncbi:hypothetical protein LZ24_02651 [Desulfobotulus alkaliphilus]|uniref:Uncharacterized protein n=1 Tax=Desulfobotulus alkaliphilus TaxID=622671 RepID=A0A562RGF3_9BACT|nr:hypothetical protein [Desulfobotulus alkaliphilus]TWI68169.1 hypothetical protein LZ24_02651 [Desulfobotulus alkaliphilus]